MKRTTITAALAACALFLAPVSHAQPPTEDSSTWDCTRDGNMICGPENSQGLPAGFYVDGILVDPWPVSPEPHLGTGQPPGPTEPTEKESF